MENIFSISILSSVLRDKWPQIFFVICRELEVSKFKFQEVGLASPEDVKISFQRRDHGDGISFDGANGILDHAFAPTDGRLHLDADERT